MINGRTDDNVTFIIAFDNQKVYMVDFKMGAKMVFEKFCLKLI